MKSALRMHAKRWMRIVLCFVGIITSLIGGSAQTTLGSMPMCTTSQIADWNDAQKSLGVVAVDPAGLDVGSFPAKRDLAITHPPNWYPIDSRKYTYCGILSEYHFEYVAGFERDWNQKIVPDLDYRFLLQNLPHAEDVKLWQCGPNKADCLEAELAPDAQYYGNPHFPRSVNKSPLEQQRICSFGPWVQDSAHDWRPEIHPSELYWWRDNPRSLMLMLLQDTSNRFSERKHFDFGSATPPATWRPWAQAPVLREFWIAFTATPSTPVNLAISEPEPPQNVITAGTDGALHTLEYQNRSFVRVEELQADATHIDVTFKETCQLASGELHGYVALTSRIGARGYHIIRVDEGAAAPVQTPPAPGAVAQERLEGAVVPGSVRRETVAGKGTLVADVDVTIRGAVGSSSVLAPLRSVRTARGEPLGFVAKSSASEPTKVFRVSKVPLVSGQQIQFLMGSESPLAIQIPAVGLKPTVTVEKAEASASDDAWPQLMAALGARSATKSLVSVQRVSRWTANVNPAYSALHDGEPAPEDASVVADELNTVVENGNSARRQQLFGTSTPFSAKWSFDARNLTTGDKVDVRIGRLASVPGRGAAANQAVDRGTNIVATNAVLQGRQSAQTPAIEVLIGDDLVKGGRLDVRFVSSGIYELTAIASITDAYDISGSVRQRFGSHVLVGNDQNELTNGVIRSIAPAADVDETTLFRAMSSEAGRGGTAQNDPASRAARILRNATLTAAEDKMVSIDELRDLVRLVRAFQAQIRR